MCDPSVSQTEESVSVPGHPRYTLRRTRARVMIDKLVPDYDFDPPIWVKVTSFGPFLDKAGATKFMLRNEGRP